MDDCVFCKIINRKIPSEIIYENEHVIAFLDISGDAEGHTLAIPKQHYENILDCPADVLCEVMKAVRRISNHFVDNCGYTGVNLLNNSGDDAHQSIFHFHIHIYPRKNGDGLNLVPALGKKKIDNKTVAACLKL